MVVSPIIDFKPCENSPFGLSRDIALELLVAGFQYQPVRVCEADV